MKNRLQKLFGIKYPIIQGGMVWCSGWELASAVSEAGGLGLLGAGSMSPDVLRQHIQKCKRATDKPFGVNLPLLFSHTEEHVKTIIDEQVKIVFSSAGSPKKYTKLLKDNGVKVAHVISNVRFARKCEEVGVDAVVAEGYEAGGHNGIEENTTMTLIPQVASAVNIPVIAAGGIATGGGLVAALALGASGVQIGSRFVVAEESSAHINFKKAVLDTKDGDTLVMLKKLVPVRLLKNNYFDEVKTTEDQTNDLETLKQIYAKASTKAGMFEGDTENGKLEIGQIAGIINKIQPAAEIINEIMTDAQKIIDYFAATTH